MYKDLIPKRVATDNYSMNR